MPTADEYRSFAGDYDQLGQDADDVRAAFYARRSTKGLGGDFGDLIDMALGELKQQFDTAADDVDAAATECLRRADVCDDYASDMRRYEREFDEWQQQQQNYDHINPTSPAPGPPPNRPSKPAPWADLP